MNGINQFGIVWLVDEKDNDGASVGCVRHQHAPHTDVVTLLPTWLAPNLITLMGVVWLMAAYILTMLYLPDYTGTSPEELLFCALMYTTNLCTFNMHQHKHRHTYKCTYAHISTHTSIHIHAHIHMQKPTLTNQNTHITTHRHCSSLGVCV